jgi:hypothetical protein
MLDCSLWPLLCTSSSVPHYFRHLSYAFVTTSLERVRNSFLTAPEVTRGSAVLVLVRLSILPRFWKMSICPCLSRLSARKHSPLVCCFFDLFYYNVSSVTDVSLTAGWFGEAERGLFSICMQVLRNTLKSIVRIVCPFRIRTGLLNTNDTYLIAETYVTNSQRNTVLHPGLYEARGRVGRTHQIELT